MTAVRRWMTFAAVAEPAEGDMTIILLCYNRSKTAGTNSIRTNPCGNSLSHNIVETRSARCVDIVDLGRFLAAGPRHERCGANPETSAEARGKPSIP